MSDIRKAESDRFRIVLDAMQALSDDFGTQNLNMYAGQINEVLSKMMPIDDLYGSNTARHGDLRHEVARVLKIKIDRRSRANHQNAARVDSVVDSFWFYTMAIRSIAKADPKRVWGFRWQSRCDERRQGKFGCQALDGREWQIGDMSMPIPVRDTGVGCNCLLFEVSSFRRSDPGGQEPRVRKKRSLFHRLFGKK